MSHAFAMLWVIMSFIISLPWLRELGSHVTMPLALFIIGGIAYFPGYVNAFTVMSLILDRQPKFKAEEPRIPITVFIACHNEEKAIGETLQYLFKQSYIGEIKVIVIDNNSSDKTFEVAERVGRNLGMDLRVIKEPKPGKHNALNAALKLVDTEWVVTLDADTLLMRSSLRFLMKRVISSPLDVVSVAGSVLVRNGRKNFWTRIQEWDYFLGIASIKRLQGMYQGTLVAQGAYSVYKTEALRAVGGYPSVIGEDIVVTWKLLQRGWKVCFEPLAVAFTDVPESFIHLQRQRSRWARGMIEALHTIKPWNQPLVFVKYSTGMNLVMPYMDVTYTLFWIPGVILAFFGYYWIAGPMTLFLLPLAIIQNLVFYNYQKKVFRQLRLRVRKNSIGFICYVLFYQALMSPISLWGYLQEVFRARWVWK